MNIIFKIEEKYSAKCISKFWSSVGLQKEGENLQLMSQSFPFPAYDNDIKKYDPNYNFQIATDGSSEWSLYLLI